MSSSSNNILVIGGTGYFGKMLVLDLLQFSNFNIVAAGRSPGHLQSLGEELSQYKSRLFTRVLDLSRENHIVEGLKNTNVVICAAGPFQELPLTLAKMCMEKSVPYIDLADDRSYVMGVRKLAEEIKPLSAVCTGWSSVPAFSGAMTNIAHAELDEIYSIYSQIAPGNKAPRGYSTVASLVSSLGKKFTVMQDGAWKEVLGWSQPRIFKFPAPIKNRTGYLVDVADHELFPDLFHAETVQFRAGAEFALFNSGVSMLAFMANAGVVDNFKSMTGLFQNGMKLFGALGHDWGALGVEVLGIKDTNQKTIRISLMAEHQGQRIPIMPASIMARRILKAESHVSGLVPYDAWIDQSELESECKMRDYRLVKEID